MAASAGEALSEREEKRLSKLRERLFESNWNSAEFKASLLDLSPSEVYSDESGFKIYIGNCNHAVDLPSLEERGITFILNMASGDHSCQAPDQLYGNSYTVMRVAAGDMPRYNISQHFTETYEFIEQARDRGTGILIHCSVGVSRSCTIVIAYLMQRHGWSFEKAGSHVKKGRTKVFPNLGFIKQLLQLENDMKKQDYSCVCA